MVPRDFPHASSRLTDSCVGGVIEYYTDRSCANETFVGTSAMTDSDLSCRELGQPIFGATYMSVACTTYSEPRLLYDSSVTRCVCSVMKCIMANTPQCLLYVPHQATRCLFVLLGVGIVHLSCQHKHRRRIIYCYMLFCSEYVNKTDCDAAGLDNYFALKMDHCFDSGAELSYQLRPTCEDGMFMQIICNCITS